MPVDAVSWHKARASLNDVEFRNPVAEHSLQQAAGWYPASMPAAGEQSAEARPPAGLGAITRENHVLRELVTIYHHLTGLALQSSDLETVIELLAQRMTCRVAVVSPTLEILAAAGPEGTPQTDRIREGLTRNRLGPVLRAA